jgi:NADPH-dependent F420 reductase
MHIAILGTGSVGRALGLGWSRHGHVIVFGSRDPASEKARAAVRACSGRASAARTAEASAGADVVVLAVPWAAVSAVLAEAGASLAGNILVDATNPIAPGLQLAVGHATSGAEQVAGWAPGARVVKAFNTTGAENMVDPVYHGQSTVMLICGDDSSAKATVRSLAEELGFDVVDAGGLALARHLEPFALLWITLAQKLGRNIAFRLVQR